MDFILWTIIDILVYNILAIKSLIFLRSNRTEFRGKAILWFLILFLCVFSAYSGDWIHYSERLEYYHAHDFNALEMIYGDIMDISGSNYLLFRLIVWGSGLLVLKLLFDRLKLGTSMIMSFFIVWGLLFYAYPRVSLALSLFFYGYSFLVKPIKLKFISYILGIALIGFSIYFHKSIIELVVLAPFSFIKLNKRRLIILVIGSILTIIIMNSIDLLKSMLELGIKGEEYLSMEAFDYSFGKVLVDTILRIPIFIVVFYIVRYICSRANDNFGFDNSFITFIILIFSLAIILLFCDIKSQVPFYRTLYMIFIPLSIVMTALYHTKLRRKILNLTVLMYIGSNMWLFYTLLGHYNGSIQ